MKLQKIIDLIDVVSIPKDAKITQFKNKEDDEPYQVWRIDVDNTKYVLKEAKEREKEIYQSILFKVKESVPTLYQIITIDEKTYLLMEYIDIKQFANQFRYEPYSKQSKSLSISRMSLLT